MVATNFNKPFSVNLSNKVSGADRKKLRRGLEKEYPHLTEDELELLLPAKNGELEHLKLASPSRAVIYTLDKVPLFVDTSGKGDIFPTVFALWRLRTLLPQVFLKHPAVSSYIVGGADVMLPGVGVPPGGLPSFASDALVSVCVPGNPAPVAVGVVLMSSQDAEARLAADSSSKGKLVEVLQVYGDHLWADLGDKAVPNDGFLADAVMPPSAVSAGAEDNISSDDPKALQEVTAGLEHVQLHAGAVSDSSSAGSNGVASSALSDAAGHSPQAVPGSASAATGGTNGDAAAACAAPDKAGGEGGKDGSAASVTSLTASQAANAGGSNGSRVAAGIELPQDMEAMLEMVLLQALHKSVKDDDLPLNSNVLWNQHMLPLRPAGCVLDVKKSMHKKMAKLLSSYAKGVGLLVVKEDKHSGDAIVTGINRNHTLYTEFRPYKTSATAAAVAAAADSAGGSSPAPASTGKQEDLILEEVWKPGKELRPIFEAVGARHDATYSASEAGEVAMQYMRQEKLDVQSPDPQLLLLDVSLCDALFKGIIKKGDIFPTHLPKAELREAFLRRCQPSTRITRGAQQIVKKGAAPTLNLAVTKRGGNKFITSIVGLESFLLVPDTVAAELQKKFSCSTSVGELPGKNAGSEVTVQGEVVDKLAAHFTTVYHIPRHCTMVKK